MPSIFISYRRQDAEVFAGRLYDRLVQEFGEDHVFMDVDTLKPGDDYLKAIERKLRRVDVFLAVIGEQWATVTGDRGSRRLEDERDLLRLEVATALKRSVRVIPVLVGGATMPRESELPADIASVTRLHAFELTTGRFRTDVQLLINSLRGVERKPAERGGKGTQQRSWITLLAVIQPLVFALSGLLLHLRAETGLDLYPSARRIFFGGLLIGVPLFVLSRRARNAAGVFQASAQFAFAAVAALALEAIDELLARTNAWSLYAAAMFFGVAAWRTVRSVSVASVGRDPVVDPGPATAPAGDVSELDQRPEHSARRPAASREKNVVGAIHGPGRWKRVSSYVLVTLDLLGLFLLVAAAVAMWSDRPRPASPQETFLIASLTTGPWMLGLMLFGWIAEVRLCWMLGVATLIPFFVLTIAGNIDASSPLALAALAGLAVAAFAVETLRRLRKGSDDGRVTASRAPARQV